MTTERLPGFSQVTACVFDAYGTLFDVHSAVRHGGAALEDKATAVSELWRQKQLEYTWLRSLMGAHAEFRQVTSDSLERSEEHTSELQSLMRISYAVFCLKKKIEYRISN